MSRGQHWSWSTDGESYTAADTRDDAVAALVSTFEGRSHGDEDFVGYVARARWHDHDEFVHVLDGDVLVEMLAEQAHEHGEHAYDYPEISAEAVKLLEERVQAAALAVLNEHVPAPSFFTAEDDETIRVHVDEHGKGHVLPDDAAEDPS